MLATQVLPEEFFEGESKKEDESDVVGFIVVENKQYEIRKGENKLGRDPAVCSIVLNNNTVSKLHAVIESEGRDDTFIYDVGSTNAVRLGKKSLKPHYRYKLDDGSVIRLGNVVAKFVLSPISSGACNDSILETPESQGENNLRNEDIDLGDIFDVATQVNVPQPSTSKSENNFQIFKLPNLLPSVKQQTKSGHEISGNGCDNLNENKLIPDETSKPVVFESSANEDSNIFSLETQAQIDASPTTMEKTTETVLNKSKEKTNSPNNVNSLLNDGQDDIFCTFMSIHSPKRKDESTSHEVVIKTEPVDELEEVFEARTQVESQCTPKNSVIEKELALLTEELQKNTNFVEEFFEQAQNDSHQNQSQIEKQTANINITDNTFKNNELILKTSERLEDENSKEINSQENFNKGFTLIRSQDEDIVQTQEFFMENFFKSTEPTSNVGNPLSKDSSENSETESCLEVPLEGSPKFDRRKTDNSDFTFPVKFMEFEEVKKNSSHLFQGEFINVVNEKSIKKELDVNNEDKNVENSHEGNSDEDDTESFLEITFEGSPIKDKTPDKFNKQSTSKEETMKDGDSSHAKESKELAPEQTVSTKPNNETINEDNEDDLEDFIETQEFGNSVTNKTPNGNSDDETQIFEPPASQNLNALTKDTINVDPGRSSPDLLSDEDFINTQTFNEGNVKNSKPFGDVLSETRREGVDSKTGQVVSALENSDDETEPYLKLDADHDEKLHPKEKNISKLNESKDSNDNHDQSRSLLLEENENSNSSYVFQLEEEDQGKETDLIIAENVILERKRESWEETKAPVCMDSDSDATDCEEIDMIEAKMMPIKEEVMEKATQAETQVLTLTLPDNFAERQYNDKEDGWMRGNESPKFEIIRESDNESNHSWSQLSLQMPSTQDVQATVKKLLENGNENVSDQNEQEKSTKAITHNQIPLETKKTEPQTSREKTEPQTSTINQILARSNNLLNEVEGGSKRLFDSPVKRNRDKDNIVEVVPVKKSRTSNNPKNDAPSSSGGEPVTNTQKVLLKLWRTHDIAQIQPTRTRNSSKNMEMEENQNNNKVTDNKFNNETPTRRRGGKQGSASKRQKTDMNPNIHQKIEEAKKSFQSERRPSNKQNERLSKGQKSESGAMRVLRNTRRTSCDLMRLKNSFDGTSGFETNVSNDRSRRFSKTINDKSSGVHVVFTGFDCESLEKVISDLGGKRVNDLDSSSETVVVADKVRRTVKFLCAMGLGLPITSPQWLWLSKKANKFLNPWNHLLKDEDSEEKWDFDLRDSLERSKKKKLLEGYSVFATENTKPPVKDLLAIAECCGGIPLIHHPEKWPKKTIVVSCLEDKNSWPSSKLRNVKIVHYEFILSGVLRQKIDFKTYKLR